MLKRMLHRSGEGVLNSTSKELSPAGTSAAFLVCWSARTCTPQMHSQSPLLCAQSSMHNHMSAADAEDCCICKAQ